MIRLGYRHRVAFSQKAENETQTFEFKYQPRQVLPLVVLTLDA